MTELTKKDFFYHIPSEQIAQTPAEKREDSKLFVYNAPNDFEHKSFKDIINTIPEGSLIIRNNTKVFASRVIGCKESGGRIEIFLLELPKNNEVGCVAECLAKPMKKLSKGTEVLLDFGKATVLSRKEGQTPRIIMQFDHRKEKLIEYLNKHGKIPLPPYIKRTNDNSEVCELDKKRYQTTYANENLVGSVAAPTSGMHFTKEIDRILVEQKSVEFCEVTLEVGGGTFLPVKVDAIGTHDMHSEWYHVSKESWEKVQEAKRSGRPIIAVGTTTLRTLESFNRIYKVGNEDQFNKYHTTDLFIYPKHMEDRYESKIIDGLITNFHQPESTLLMLISALIGIQNARSVYKEAIAKKYRFFSYGDSSLLWLNSAANGISG